MATGETVSSRIFSCTQCPKIFATRSNLKRHMENPNIHNIPYVRSRDQKRWKGHAKKVVSKEETTERMRKWRAENREKNRQNDLRCRVYRLARQKFGEQDSPEKQQFVRDEIARRLGRRLMLEQQKGSNNNNNNVQQQQQQLPARQTRRNAVDQACKDNGSSKPNTNDLVELPFYSAPQQKIELPSIGLRRPSPGLPPLSPSWRSQRRTSSSSISTLGSYELFNRSSPTSMDDDDPTATGCNTHPGTGFMALPPMHTMLSFASSPFPPPAFDKDTDVVRYVEHTRILDEFVGVVLNYAGHYRTDEHSSS